MYKVLWYSPLGERGNRPIIKESGMDIEQAILAVRASRVDAVIEKAKAYAKANYNNGMDYFYFFSFKFKLINDTCLTWT